MQFVGPTLQPMQTEGLGLVDPFLAKAKDEISAEWPASERRVLEAAQALENGSVDEAKRILSKFLARSPKQPDALNLMAEVAQRCGDLGSAERCLAECVYWSPHHAKYRYNYVILLMKLKKLDGALTEATRLVEQQPGRLLFHHVHCSLLLQTWKYAEAAPLLRRLTEEYPDSPVFWLLLGECLRSMGGHSEESTAAFHRTVELAPSLGKAWWSLASMKTYRFTDRQIRAMEAQLDRPPFSATDRANLHYALGKAYDDVKNYEKSFQNYAKGNAIRRVELDYDPESTTSMVTRAKETFTQALFQEKGASGCGSREPVFVVGLQRAGSTLLEQILGSHSRIEPLGELQTVLRIVAEDIMPKTGPNYPYGMEKLTSGDLTAAGEKYLSESKHLRHQDKPFFVDKCPYNLWHVGLIHLMFPNAKIIDIRRHPIGCCYANFTMSFVHAPPLSYKLSDIGRFYADYVRLMAHIDKVLPGMIHRVIYEDLVANLEHEVRRLLNYLELPFEQGCLEYYKMERAFSSFSNEQVRQPIFKEGVERWRNYEPYLGSLKAALGPVLDAYPGVPEFHS